jgi:hypothetical protein
MPRITPSNVTQMPARINGQGPQPPDGPTSMRPRPASHVLDCTRDEMARRWLSGVKMASIRRRFGVSPLEAEAIIRSGVKVRVAELRRIAA